MHKYRIATFILLLALSSCQPFQPIEIRDIQSANLYENKEGSTILDMEMVVFNPNPFEMEIKGHDLEIFLNQKKIGTSLSEKTYTLKSNEEFKIDLDVETKFNDLLSGALFGLGAWVGKEDVNVIVRGEVKTKTLFFTTSAPVEEKIKIFSNNSEPAPFN